MKTRALLIAAAASAGMAAAANAQLQPVTIDWRVDGQNAVSVNPGTTVTVVGYANWAPSPFVGGFASSLFNVNLVGANLSDTLAYSGGGLGRNPALSLAPQTILDMPMPGMRMISSNAGVIDTAQLPAFINPFFDASNPIELFRFTITPGDADRTIDIGSTQLTAQLYDFIGMPVDGVPVIDGASISVVPAPGSAALLGLSGLVAIRRRRSR